MGALTDFLRGAARIENPRDAIFDPAGGARRQYRQDTRGGGGGTASEAFAALTRQQWQNYVRTFVPIENQLIDYATNPEVVQRAMTSASQDVAGAYETQQGTTTRRLQGLGVSLTPEEQMAQQRSFGLSKSLADVQAQNVARDLTRQRQQSIMGNPAPDAVTLSGRM